MRYAVTRRAALGAPFAFVATGCFSGAGRNAGNTEGQDTAGPVQRGGTLVVATDADADTLDPHKDHSTYTHRSIAATYSKLIEWKTGPDVGYTQFIRSPDLSHDWSISRDGLTYTFQLRDDIVWQDVPPVNGRAFTSDDVLATMRRIQDLPGIQAHMLQFVGSIQVPDDHTVVFELERPFAPFLNYMASHFMWILPREGVEGEFDLENKAIGTGPFILDTWDREKEMLWISNPSYFQQGRPYVAEVRTVRVPEESTRIAGLRGGGIDITTVSATQGESAAGSMPDMELSQQPVTLASLFMNLQREPFSDLRVRQAMARAIDRRGLGEALHAGATLSGAVAPTMGRFALPEDDVDKLQPYDPEGAKKLLADAGYPDGFETTVIVTDGYGEEVVRGAQWVQQDLADVGIGATLDVQEYATYQASWHEDMSYDMGFGLATPYAEADEWLYVQYHTEGYGNDFGIDDPRLDELIDGQRRILDAEKRVEQVHAIQRYIIENVSNPIPVYVYKTNTLYVGRVQDYFPHVTYHGRFYKDVWLDRK